jgi:hypothetical protein
MKPVSKQDIHRWRAANCNSCIHDHKCSMQISHIGETDYGRQMRSGAIQDIMFKDEQCHELEEMPKMRKYQPNRYDPKEQHDWLKDNCRRCENVTSCAMNIEYEMHNLFGVVYTDISSLSKMFDKAKCSEFEIKYRRPYQPKHKDIEGQVHWLETNCGRCIKHSICSMSKHYSDNAMFGREYTNEEHLSNMFDTPMCSLFLINPERMPAP